MSLADFLFEGKAPPSLTNTVTSISGLPDWYQEFQRGIMARGNAIAGEPYKPFTGPRVADFTPDQLNAFETIRQSMGSGQAGIDLGMQAAGTAATPFNQQIFDQFKSPYVEGVVNRIGELSGRNLSENLLPKVNDTFTGAGIFGGGRHGEFTARAVRDANESGLGQMAIALQQAQDNAMANYNNAMDRTGRVASTAGNLGLLDQTRDLRDAAALEGVGSTIQGLNQRDLDTTYQEFVEQRDFPRSNLGMLNSLLRGIGNVPTSTTQTTTGQTGQYNPSPLAQIAGAASGAAGLMNLFR